MFYFFCVILKRINAKLFIFREIRRKRIADRKIEEKRKAEMEEQEAEKIRFKILILKLKYNYNLKYLSINFFRDLKSWAKFRQDR